MSHSWELKDWIRLTRNNDLTGIAATIAPLAEAELAAAREAFLADKNLRFRIDGDAAVMLAALLQVTPGQFVAIAETRGLSLAMKTEPDPALISALTARGRQWGSEVVALATSGGTKMWVLMDVIQLLVRIHQFPIPTAPDYLRYWMANPPKPSPGSRWAEHLALVCAIPNALAAPQANAVHETDDVNQEPLLLALLQVISRADRSGVQRAALMWIKCLGLESLAADHARLIIEALPTAASAVVKFCLTHLDLNSLPPNQLAALAEAAITRNEKGPKRAMLRYLLTSPKPNPDLLELVQYAATGTDADTQALAVKVLESWGADGGFPDQQGLWRNPCAEGPRQVNLGAVPTEPELAELVTEISLPAHQQQPGIAERVLAALIALGYEHGPEAVTAALASIAPVRYGSFFLEQISDWLCDQRGIATPRARSYHPLTAVAAARYRDALGAIGNVPILLSTPTHAGNQVSWEALAERLQRYLKAGIEPIPSDLIVALARVAAPGPGLPDIPVGKTTVGRIEELWRQPRKPAELGWPDEFNGVIVTGDQPAAELLASGGVWPTSYHPLFASEDREALQLLPAHSARPAASVLTKLSTATSREDLARCIDRFALVADSALPWNPVVAFTAFALAGHAPPALREPIAQAMLHAWDQGRLDKDVLKAGWNPRWLAHWPSISVTRVVTVMAAVADSGGLALVWPMLVLLGEKSCCSPKEAAVALEAVLSYLPELPGGYPVDIPGIEALAASKARNKATRLAREIIQRLGDRPH